MLLSFICSWSEQKETEVSIFLLVLHLHPSCVFSPLTTQQDSTPETLSSLGPESIYR